EEPVVDEPAAVEVEPAAVFEPFESAPVVARADPFGVVRLEFLSEQPKGVLTLYVGGEQAFSRPFRFFQRKGLMRRRGV
ncbi:hypothetical protein DF186_24980, partial [Enterococcus hirae]